MMFVSLFLESLSTVRVLQILSYLLGLVSILANTAVIGFYRSGAAKLYHLLYLLNATSDLLGGVGAVLLGAVLGGLCDDVTKVSSRLVFAVFWVVGVSVRVSIMCGVVIAVVRAINVVRPQYRVSYWGVLGALVAVFCFWVAMTSLEMWYFVTKETQGSCYHQIEGITVPDGGPPGGAPPDGAPPDGAPPDGAPPDGGPPDGAPPDGGPPDSGSSGMSREQSGYLEELLILPLLGKEITCKFWTLINTYPGDMDTVILKGFPFFLPSLILIACLVITTVRLLGSNMGQRSSRRLTITVLYLTLVTVTCHVPYFLLLLVLGHPEPASETQGSVVGRFVSDTVLSLVNAAVVPLVLVWRSRKIRKYYGGKVRRASTASTAWFSSAVDGEGEPEVLVLQNLNPILEDDNNSHNINNVGDHMDIVGINSTGHPRSS